MRRLAAEPLSLRSRSAVVASVAASPASAPPSSFHPLLSRPPTPTVMHTAALLLSRAGVKYRNLSPDDPFGEKSTWEDPSDGIYAQWKDVDQDGFVAAAASADVRQAHFGPEWARFSTVGRMSFAKMKEEEKAHHGHTHHTREGGGAGEATDTEGQKRKHEKEAVRGGETVTQAERLHQRDLDARRNLLKKNYQSYEDFVEMELLGGSGGGGGDRGGEEGEEEGSILHHGGQGAAASTEHPIRRRSTTAPPAVAASSPTAQSKLYTEATMEEAFFQQVDGIDSKDRMVLRDTHRDELADAEALSEAEPMPVPEFMRQAAASPQPDQPAPPSSPVSTSSPVAGATAQRVPPTPLRRPTREETTTTSATKTTTSAAAQPDPDFVSAVLAALGPLHGHADIPLTDPSTWDTEAILTFLKTAERYDAATATVKKTRDTEGGAEEEEEERDYVMDDVMEDAFRMATVTGETLLHVVMPPRLFRVLRRWHVRRGDVVRSAWRQQQQRQPQQQQEVENTIKETVAQGRKALDEVTQQVTPELIRETILLCFPYGGAAHA